MGQGEQWFDTVQDHLFYTFYVYSDTVEAKLQGDSLSAPLLWNWQLSRSWPQAT